MTIKLSVNSVQRLGQSPKIIQQGFYIILQTRRQLLALAIKASDSIIHPKHPINKRMDTENCTHSHTL